jgi:hypothetical protein
MSNPRHLIHLYAVPSSLDVVADFDNTFNKTIQVMAVYSDGIHEPYDGELDAHFDKSADKDFVEITYDKAQKRLQVKGKRFHPQNERMHIHLKPKGVTPELAGARLDVGVLDSTLLIRGPDGELYEVEVGNWKKVKLADAHKQALSKILDVLEQTSVSAANITFLPHDLLPQNELTSEPVICYLLNLPAIRAWHATPATRSLLHHPDHSDHASHSDHPPRDSEEK